MSPFTLGAWLYVAALAVNLAFGFATHFRLLPGLLEADEREYYTIASRLLAGTWEITPRRTIGFPLLIAAVRACGANLIELQAVITALYSLSTPLLFLLVRRLGRAQGAALLAALALTFWPPALYFGSSLYSETAALPVFLLALCCLPPGSRIPSRTSRWVPMALVAGIVLGFAAHLRPMYLLYLPFLLLTIVFEERRWRVAAVRFAVTVAGFLLVVLPWSTYVSTRFDRTILLTSNGGETLAGGLTPKLLEPRGHYSVKVADRTAWVGPGKWLTIPENGYLSDAELKLPYAQADGLLRARASAWVWANPGKAAWLELCKLTYMWGVLDLGSGATGLTLLGDIAIIALLCMSLYLFARRPHDRAALARLWLLAGFVSMVALISWGSWRFRQPGDAGLLAYCAIGLYDMARARVQARGSVPGPLTAR